MEFMIFLLVLMVLFTMSYLINFNHILSMLIILESLMFIVLSFFFVLSLNYLESSSLFLLILTFAACEAAIGLSILVSVIRYKGSDLIKSISVWFA